MERVLLACFTSFFVSLTIVPLVINIAKRTNFFDLPGGRRIHKTKTPSLGGIAIFVGFSIGAFAFLGLARISEVSYFFVSIFVIFLTGVRDDIDPLSARLKMLGQLLGAYVLVHFGGCKLTGLHGLLGIHEVPIYLQYLISILTIIVITNSLNLIDGIDGLAGSIFILAALSFGTWFYFAQIDFMLLLIAPIIGAVLGFLVFNISPAKIFMGDSGSLVLGFFLSFLAIYFIEKVEEVRVLSVYEPVSLSVAILLYPLFDLLRVFVLRMSKGQSPFTGDKTHIHHILLRTGLNHNKATGVIFLYSALVILLAFRFNQYGLLGGFAVIFIMCAIALALLQQRVKKFTNRSRSFS